MHLNKVKEEAELIKKYSKLYIKKLDLAEEKNIKFYPKKLHPEGKDVKKPESQVWQWFKSTGQYLSTYAIQVGTPVVMAVFSPAASVLTLSIVSLSSGSTI